MEYEVYRHNDASDEKFTYIDEMFKQVLKEDKDLCNAAQKNLNAGIFNNGELHPRVEKVATTNSYSSPNANLLPLRARCSSRISHEGWS